MGATRYMMLSIVGFMAVVGIGIFIFNLARPNRLKPMMTETCIIVPFLSLAGVLGFTIGLGLFFFNEHQYGLELAGGGFLACCGSILLNAVTARMKRSAWPVVSARCMERMLEKKISHEGTDFWRWRLVCEINYVGKDYQVVPKIRWSDAGQSETPFWTEAKAQQFLAQMISENGECKLRVNPNNPLEAELIR